MITFIKRKTGITGEMATVLAMMGLTTLAMALLNPIMPLYLTSIDIGATVLGTMLSVAMFGMAIGEAGWGYLTDIIGTRWSLLSGTFCTGLSVLFFVFTRSIPLIFVIFFVWGFLRSAIFGPARGYIGAAAPPEKKSTFMALSSVMLAASGSLGALPSGILVDNFGYDAAFFASTGVSVLAGILVITRLRNLKMSTEIPGEPVKASPSQKSSFNLFSLTPQCVVTALMFFGMGTTMTFLPLLANQVLGVNATMIGVLFTINGLVNVVLAIPMGMLADRLGKKTVMMIGLTVVALSMTGISFVGNYWLLVLLVICNSIGMVLFSPAALGLFSDSVPRHRQSTAMGIYGGVCENVGILGGSALGGVIWDTLGHQPTFLFGAAAAAIGMILCLILVKKTPQIKKLVSA